jgi:hypothetical protein
MHLRRTLLPAVGAEEGAAALARVLMRRGGRVRDAVAATLVAALEPGTRLFSPTAIVEADIVVAWVLDETDLEPEPDVWDPLLARELSAELGGFAVSVETSRSFGRAGRAVFFAGRTVEFISDNPEEQPLAIGQARDRDGDEPAFERVYAGFADLYTRLTGWPYPAPDAGTRLASVMVMGCPCVSGWRPHAGEERPLALAVFPLAGEREFAAVWEALPATATAQWRWRPALTSPADIPYVVLAREGGLDAALCEALAGRLDIPAAAVGLTEPGVPFESWRAQPGRPAQRGFGLGAAELVQCLMSAVSALGERPGILRIGRRQERAPALAEREG